MRSKELSVETRDRIVSRLRSGEGYQKISAALKVPKNTVASIILKCKKFGTTKTLPRAGCIAKQSNGGEWPWSGRWPRGWSLWQNFRVPLWRWEKTSRRTTISAALHLYDRVARRKPLLSKRPMTARLELTERPLNYSQTMRIKIIWSDGTTF